jgi:aspartate racemase
MAKHVGIVACSAPGAALCYRTLCDEGPGKMGRHRHPEITLHNVCLADYMEAVYRDDWGAIGEILLESTRKVAEAGADFAICPDNTVHQAYDDIAERLPIPWLHIADVVAERAVRQGYSRLGVIGTRYLMEGPVYPRSLERHGVEFAIPDEEQREKIDAMIFDELVNGIIEEGSRRRFHDVIESLRDRGCDAVVRGCTEIPLIVRPEISALPTLDSTRLLARAALAQAIE